MSRKAVEWARANCGMYSTIGSNITIEALSLERLIDQLTAAQQRVAELEQWSKCAEEAMRKLVDAHEQLNRPKLERALMGIKILPMLILSPHPSIAKVRSSCHTPLRCA